MGDTGLDARIISDYVEVLVWGCYLYFFISVYIVLMGVMDPWAAQKARSFSPAGFVCQCD